MIYENLCFKTKMQEIHTKHSFCLKVKYEANIKQCWGGAAILKCYALQNRLGQILCCKAKLHKMEDIYTEFGMKNHQGKIPNV
jgi:hypothetical protein